jgi:alpha-beta hydrolase superfamily lysophospholipase
MAEKSKPDKIEKPIAGWKRRFLTGSAKRAIRYTAWTVFGGAVMGLIVAVKFLNSKPDLTVWHEVRLKEEFRASDKLDSFADYLALEDRLFEELEEKVYAEVSTDNARQINRYNRGSMADPGRWPRDWNRSFELAPENAKAGVLLLHGMSDSPYSLHTIGARLHAGGAHVVGLRIPGHGTAPSGLLKTKWEDMAAAVKLAMRHLADKGDGAPLYIVGYSNGGALAVNYALQCLHDDDLPKASRLVLISPSIGVSRMAAFAQWQSRLGHVLGLNKLAWNAVQPEYDPFKYGSFSLNAAVQVYRLTEAIKKSLKKAAAAGALKDFPPVLAFQSVVDATVSTPALVNVLFKSLPKHDHELVLFDINRVTEIEPFLTSDPSAAIASLASDRGLSFTATLVTNRDPDSHEVVVKSRRPGAAQPTVTETGLSWPRGIYSLSHVGLPFPETDPLYGGPAAGESPGISIGPIALRGERGVLQIPAGTMLRLRWNPFYSYLEGRLLGALGMGEEE